MFGRHLVAIWSPFGPQLAGHAIHYPYSHILHRSWHPKAPRDSASAACLQQRPKGRRRLTPGHHAVFVLRQRLPSSSPGASPVPATASGAASGSWPGGSAPCFDSIGRGILRRGSAFFRVCGVWRAWPPSPVRLGQQVDWGWASEFQAGQEHACPPGRSTPGGSDSTTARGAVGPGMEAVA